MWVKILKDYSDESGQTWRVGRDGDLTAAVVSDAIGAAMIAAGCAEQLGEFPVTKEESDEPVPRNDSQSARPQIGNGGSSGVGRVSEGEGSDGFSKSIV